MDQFRSISALYVPNVAFISQTHHPYIIRIKAIFQSLEFEEILFLTNDTNFANILPNKGKISYLYPLLYTYFAYLRRRQILSQITCPPHGKICTANPGNINP